MIREQIREATALLRDDGLVWSPDFEHIRLQLADLLDAIELPPSYEIGEALDGLLPRLLAIEPDENIDAADPLEAWIRQSTRTLSVIQAQTQQAPGFREALKKLFNAL